MTYGPETSAFYMSAHHYAFTNTHLYVVLRAQLLSTLSTTTNLAVQVDFGLKLKWQRITQFMCRMGDG